MALFSPTTVVWIILNLMSRKNLEHLNILYNQKLMKYVVFKAFSHQLVEFIYSLTALLMSAVISATLEYRGGNSDYIWQVLPSHNILLLLRYLLLFLEP